METMTAREAKNTFGTALQKAQQAPVQITKGGKPFAVLVSMEDYKLAEQLKLRELRRMIERGDAELEAGDFVDGAAFMEDLLNGI